MKHTQQKGLRQKMLAVSTLSLFGLGMLAATPTLAASTEQLYRQSLNNVGAKGLTSQFSLTNASSLKASFSAPTHRGTTTTRMQQMYRGVPVYGRSVAVERSSSGQSLLATGLISQGLEADLASVKPRLSGDQALDILQGQTRGNSATGLGSASRATGIRNRQATLYVYPEDGASARLVYLASFVKDGNTPSRPSAIVDALSGKIIEQWDGLATANGTGPGGNGATGQYQYGSNGHPYLNVTQSGNTCSMQNSDVKTYDMNNATSGSGSLWTFSCFNSSGDGVNGAYSPINDAHHNGGVVHDMYQSWFGSPPLNQVLYMRVHYGSNYENAFWDGTAMTFGDGASYFYPLTALDVTGHEISHGFTEQHSGLQYSGQSGGMNEAFSDMAGEAVKYFDRGSNDWLVGADITKGSSPLRYMCTPSQDGSSIDSALDYYNGIDVHNSSGVYNKAFCVLAKKSGWNTKKAFEVFYRANSLYWTSASSFNAGACGAESAADDLGYSSSDVFAAFGAVDVKCPGSDGGDGGDGGSGGGALSNGVAVTVPSASSGNFTGDYTIAIPSGATNLKVTIGGGSGDADLYVKLGSAPTTSSYDCRPYKNGSSEACSFASPSTGTYHVKLRAYQTFANVSLKATWDTSGGGDGGDGGGALSNGVAVTVGATSSGNFSDDYTIAIPSGASNLQVTIGGGSGDADLYVKYGSEPTTSSYTCRPYKNGSSEQCTIASPSTGTYHVKLRAYQSFANVSLKATWDTSGGGDDGGGSNGVYDNGTNIAIPDGGSSATSAISVSGEGSSASANLKVRVKIVHSYRGDLRITIIAPNGGSAVLKSPSAYDNAANVNTTYTVDASGVGANGTWKLKVEDIYSGSTGYIDNFGLTF